MYDVAADFDDDVRRMIEANEANWDQRTPIHVASRFYGVDGSRDPEDWFADFEWTDLGDLTGRNLVHLQCHLGTETIVLARHGARATRLDFSEASVGGAPLHLAVVFGIAENTAIRYARAAQQLLGSPIEDGC